MIVAPCEASIAQLEADSWTVVVMLSAPVAAFSKPPALGEEALGQAGKGGAIGNEVLFHVGRMPMAFADYVRAMRRDSGFWSEPSRLHRDAFGRKHVLRQIIFERAFH